MGSTVSTILRIRNLTDCDVSSVYVYDIDSFDFGTNSRPDKVLNGASIPANSCIERTIDVTSIASNCPFSMKMMFRNGSEDVIRLHYKCVYDSTEPSFRHLTRSHRIYYKKAGPRVLEIILENTEQQKENIRAVELNREGSKLMAAGKYHEASIKFMEATQRATQSETVAVIQNNCQKLKDFRESVDVDKRAKGLNNEGLQLLRANKFNEALKKFREGLELAKSTETLSLIEDNLKIAKEAKVNQDAKKLNQEGLILRKDNQNEAALLKFDEALRIAIDNKLINSVKTNKADTLKKEGGRLLEEAWGIEMSAPDEAIHEFSRAKFLFQQADSVKPSPECLNNIALIDCRIEGSRYFNMALQLENEGSHLIDKTVQSELSQDCKIAKDKYEEAWKRYKEARNKFEEGRKIGDANFDRWLALIDQALQAIEKILNELEKAELEIALVTNPT